MGILYKTNGDAIPMTPADPERGFTLKELYAAIDTDMVETLNLPDGRVLIMDEDGKIKNKQPNELATAVARQLIHVADYIVGDVVICDPREFQ